MKRKQINRNVITFERGDDNECVALAMLGMSNKTILNRTDLSDGQITYRLHKAKTTEGNRVGYRADYRNCTSTFAIQLVNDVIGVLREEVRRTITPKITHPTPRTTK